MATDTGDEMWIGLRAFLERVDDIGELERVSGVHWDKEMSTISHLVCSEHPTPAPALLFDDIPGYPSGYRTLYAQTNSINRAAIAYGMPTGYDGPMDFVQAYHDRSKEIESVRAVDPEFVPASEVALFENVQTGDDVDLFSVPVPLHHEHDGGRYIGTADCVITRDTASGEINVGTYRMQAYDETTASVFAEEGHHAREHIQDHFEEHDEPFPFAATFGQDPTLFIFAGIGLHHTHDFGEYAHTGGLKGRPYPLVEGPETGLPLPADAEIAIEGYIHKGETRPEGPFGEWPGYIRPNPHEEPVIRVEALYHRDDPILGCAVPGKPPYDYSYHKSLTRSANLWEQIEAAGVPNVTGVWRTEAGGARLFNVIRVKASYPGHARQAAYVAAHTQAGGGSNRWTVVVDDDIDITDWTEVAWAMATRCLPKRDIEIADHAWAIPSEMGVDADFPTNSRAIVDATIPYEEQDSFPAVAAPSPELRARMLEDHADLIHGDD